MPVFSPYAPQLLTKTAADSRNFLMDFSDFAEVIAGETIVSVTSVSISGTGAPTVGAPSIVTGNKVRFRLSAGTAPAADATARYAVVVICVTSGGNTIERRGILFMVN